MDVARPYFRDFGLPKHTERYAASGDNSDGDPVRLYLHVKAPDRRSKLRAYRPDTLPRVACTRACRANFPLGGVKQDTALVHAGHTASGILRAGIPDTLLRARTNACVTYRIHYLGCTKQDIPGGGKVDITLVADTLYNYELLRK